MTFGIIEIFGLLRPVPPRLWAHRSVSAESCVTLWRERFAVQRRPWARGFFVNTVGRDEDAIRAYIRNQEKEDQRLEQINLRR
jgi:REP element-mobilizing transposase RayT